MNKVNTKYLDQFVQLTCGPDMLKADLFPNAKEITESFACYAAAKHLDLKLDDREVTVWVVGDGHRPRTAATFAFRSRWWCNSIDPVLTIKDYGIKRLELARSKIEDVNGRLDTYDSPSIIVMPHSHAKLSDCLDKIKSKRRSVITLDCCFKNVISGHPPDFEYIDEGVLSPQNLIRVWRDV